MVQIWVLRGEYQMKRRNKDIKRKRGKLKLEERLGRQDFFILLFFLSFSFYILFHVSFFSFVGLIKNLHKSLILLKVDKFEPIVKVVLSQKLLPLLIFMFLLFILFFDQLRERMRFGLFLDASLHLYKSLSVCRSIHS